MQHPSAAELAQYAARTLPVSALLAVDDHLAGCAVCRTAVAASVGGAAAGADGVSGAAGPAAVAGGGAAAGRAVAPGAAGGKLTLDDAEAHLSYEELEAMAEGRAPADEHARECAMCAAELRDLRALVEKRRWSRVPWWLPAGAAVAASIALTVFLTSRPSPTTVPQPVEVAAIRDGSLTLTLDAQGRITGAPFDATAVNAALAAGEIAGPAEAGRGREQLLGDAAAASGAVISPVAETVEPDRPVFRWTAVKGARSYRVEVYDAQFNEAARSGAVTATEWQPERPLPRGASYSWIVSAGDVRFPQPPAPEARFRVLGAEAAAEVDTARRSGSRLLLAVVAGRHGLWREARAAVAEVAAQNPSSQALDRLQRNTSRSR